MATTEVPISKKFSENIDYLLKEMHIEKNFDIIYRKLEYGGKDFGLFFVDGFAKDDVLLLIMRELKRLTSSDLRTNTIDKLVQTFIPYIEVETTEDLEEVIGQILAGQAALIVDGCTQALLIDIREYPVRSPEEPDIERVVRGPRDGFVETIVFNCTLIRRRIRDRSLVMEYIQVGKRSQTDIALAYIDSIADPELVKRLKKQLEDIDVSGLSMGEKTLEEFIFGKNLNPYPMVRYSERADTCAVHLQEGHVLIIVDGTPSVMICPTTFWHHLQHAEEYRQKPIVGAFLRWVRFIAVAASLFLLPLWYLFATNQHLLPASLKFIGPEEVGQIPLFWQFIIAEIGIEVLRMAAIHTPNALATALGLVAALLIGEIAVEVGLLTSEVILYLAVAVTGTFATPSYELSLANRISRLLFLISTAIFGLYGLIGAVLLWFILLASTKTLNVPYMWPLIPFNAKAMFVVLFRVPIPMKLERPSILNPQDKTND
ncbi:spore germination protein [Desulfofalx alkaliphila]|uniref:spore germination protein n=1 Tax=Desulfofalx alkaliphila TaxID=105483 RepID=UPI0004E25CE7|nr:spore germination protein [Desulfofalx alkaliphila]